ncbi:MAG: hypothetical protein GY796_25185 [Chloroflexi bacterium]|nr:hypothetical protein [Chloroflexota bacterium]
MRKDVAQLMDKVMLGLMNWRIPDSLAATYQAALPFEAVLAQTRVDGRQTAVTQLSAPGTQTIVLDTPEGKLQSRVIIRLAVDPHAPLLIYHHGLGEYPVDKSWRRLFVRPLPFPMHRVFIQAPYHTHRLETLDKGFGSLQNIYQMLAGSLRMMELIQDYFEEQGTAFTVLAGVSWGGLTSLLYAGVFQRARAVVPMLASPNIAQTVGDIAALFSRPLPISLAELHSHLDFTPTYQQIEHEHVYPLLGQDDLFFRWEHHAPLFAKRPLVTIPGSHISNLWRIEPLRQHLWQSLMHFGE